MNIDNLDSEILKIESDFKKDIKDTDRLLEAADRAAEVIVVQEGMLQRGNIQHSDIHMMLHSMRETCRIANIAHETMSSYTYLSIESGTVDTYSVCVVALEDAKSIYNKIIEMIKNLFTKLINSLKTLAIKIATVYPIIENNCNNLINYIEASKRTKPFDIPNREAFKWIINKMPMMFMICRDMPSIENMLTIKTNTAVVDNVVKDCLNYGSSLLTSPDVNMVGFTTAVNNVANEIVNGKDTGPYSAIFSHIQDLNKDTGKKVIYRLDGKIVKYRVISSNGTTSGITDLSVSNRVFRITTEEEERIVLGKMFSPDELSRLLRKNMQFISSINTFHSGMKIKLNEVNSLTDKIDKYYKANSISSGAYMAALNNYYRLVKPLISNLTAEMLISYYRTAQDIYYMVLKYCELGFKADRSLNTISNESHFITVEDFDDLHNDNLPEVLSLEDSDVIDGDNNDLLNMAVTPDDNQFTPETNEILEEIEKEEILNKDLE